MAFAQTISRSGCAESPMTCEPVKREGQVGFQLARLSNQAHQLTKMAIELRELLSPVLNRSPQVMAQSAEKQDSTDMMAPAAIEIMRITTALGECEAVLNSIFGALEI